MTIESMHDPLQLQIFGQNFIAELKKAMQNRTPAQTVASAALEKLYNMLCEIEPNNGFVVRHLESQGPYVDIFDDTEMDNLQTWMDTIYGFNGDRSNWSFFSLKDTQKYFLELLGFQVLTNIPKDEEQAIRHVCVMVASLFNGANPEGVRFELHFVDYSIVDGEWGESTDISDYLIV